MREEKWENTGRDRITLQELMELNEDGFEFTLADGHIISVVFRS